MMTGRDNIGKRRRILAELLIGQKDFPCDAKVSSRKGPAESKEGVWIMPVEYESRGYPNYITGKGDMKLAYKRDKIKGFLLEPEKPNGKAAIALHQHNLEFGLGKSEVAGLRTGKRGREQQYGLELAKMGYHVLCFDFLPFEDRMIGHEEFGAYGGERLVKQEGSLDGLELMGIHVLDVMRGIDILNKEGFNEIGVVGHSLGGMVSAYSMACDERIKAGASNCGMGSFESVRSSGILHNWAWTVHGMRKEFGEIYKLFELIAPRPFLISAARNDKYFPIEGARACATFGRGFYKSKRNLELYEFNGGHSFPKEARERVYRFLEEHL